MLEPRRPFTLVWLRPMPLVLKRIHEEINREAGHLLPPYILSAIHAAVNRAVGDFNCPSAFLMWLSSPDVASLEEAKEYVEANRKARTEFRILMAHLVRELRRVAEHA